MQFFYTVKSGDTLARIADRHDVSLDNLIAANEIKNPDTLAVGEQLSIPAGIHEYAVKTGDSLYQLAEKYGINTSAIAKENNLHPPYLLKVGQKLKIPPGVPYYIVQKEDTLETIARRFNVQIKGVNQVALIQKVNQLPDTEIKEGMRLRIPYPRIGDNGFIAYNSAHVIGPDIWLYNVKTGENEQLTDGIGASFSKPVWSNDSSKIAFVGRDQIIYVIYHETGLIGAIDQLDEGGDFTLNWAPDNETLAYATRGIIMLYNTTSHESREVNQPGASNVNWFPNGKELLFVALDSSGSSQLYRSLLTGAGKVKVTKNTDGPIHDAQISKDGKFALYTTPGASISLIKVADIKTEEVFEIEGGPEGKNYFPEWASNSKKIAYSSTVLKNQNYRSQIRTVLFNGENDQVQAMANCYSTPVTWSPAAEWLAYLSGCGGEFSTELWAVDTDEKLPIKLLEGKHIYHLQWSPTTIPDFKTAEFTSETFDVNFQYPISWKKVSDDRYEGEDGFFQISALLGSDNLEEVCHAEAHQDKKPYGSNPTIQKNEESAVQSCLIMPSDDQPADMKNQAAFIVKYPAPITINDTTYNYFVLWADKNHIEEISSTVMLLP